MGDTWITAAEHHVVTAQGRKELPPAWRRRADLTGKLVIAAATVSQGFLFKSSIPCLRRPKRIPCPGVIHFRAFDEPEEIKWFCVKCDDNGTISGWKNTIDHFRSIYGPAKIYLEPLCELFVTQEEFQVLVSLHLPIQNVQRYQVDQGQVVLGTITEMEPLLEAITHAQSQAIEPKEKKDLLELFERVEDDLWISKDLAEELENTTRLN